MKKKIFISALAVSFLFTLSAQAAIFKSGDELNIWNTTENLYLAGGTVNVSGNINGGLFLAGGDVNVNSNTTVASDLHLAGGNVTLGSHIVGESLIAAGSLKILPEFKADKNVYIISGNAVLAGQFNGDVNVNAGSLTIDPSTKILGTLTYSTEKETQIPTGAQIGKVVFDQSQVMNKKTEAKVFSVIFFSAIFLHFLALLFTTLLLFHFFGKKIKKLFTSNVSNFWGEALRGLVVLVMFPVIMILLFMLVLGYYTAIIFALFYIISLLFVHAIAPIAMVFLAQKYLMKSKKAEEMSYWKVVLGVFVFQLIGFIPFIGWFINFVIFLFVFGIVWKNMYQVVKGI